MTDTTTTSSVAANAGAAAAAQAAAGKTTLTTDKTQFLTLLTAQLKYQDPLSPMDSTQFTNQLVQYSAVEQQININSNLATLITLTQQNVLAGASAYIGKAIQATNDTAPLQNGQLNAQYNLSGNAANTTIVVHDASGNVVYSAQGETGAGNHMFSWNGQSSSGQQLPDGAYGITITALGSDGTPVNESTTVYGTVTSATIDPTSNQTMLNMGGVPVALDKVVAVG